MLHDIARLIDNFQELFYKSLIINLGSFKLMGKHDKIDLKGDTMKKTANSNGANRASEYVVNIFDNRPVNSILDRRQSKEWTGNAG